MYEYALYVLIAIVTSLLTTRKIVNHVYIGRKGLPPGLPAQAALPPAAVTAEPPTPLELAGILEVYPEFRSKEGRNHIPHVMLNGARHFLINNLTDERECLRNQRELLGVLMWNSCGTCGYCANGNVRIRQVIRQIPPPGSIDMGLVRIVTIGVYCRSCGLLQDGLGCTADSPAIQPRPEPFRTHKNLFGALEALARDNGRLTKRIRLDMLLAESARLRERSDEVAKAAGRLTRELNPTIEGEAYRDD